MYALMRMDSKPNPCLPIYDHESRCSECGRIEVHRIKVYSPSRGLTLVCGVCAFLLGQQVVIETRL